MEQSSFDIVNFIGVIIGGLVMGAICGLGPLISGTRRGFRSEGITGFIVCIVCGAILGILLAGPVALIWSILLLTRRRASDQSLATHPAGGPMPPPLSPSDTPPPL